jgi:stearoyl-CoA 9-desaturase NADPH oxidoreductase
MAKNSIKISANVVDTARPTVAGADKHPGWHALRTPAA